MWIRKIFDECFIDGGYGDVFFFEELNEFLFVCSDSSDINVYECGESHSEY